MARKPQQPRPDDRPAESDERFPSGPWLGFWLQRPSTTRQWMQNLHLHFSEGRVIGAGSDCVGEFTFQGTYDLESGQVKLRKQYVEAHRVGYEGRNEGDGQWVWGLWTLSEVGLPLEQGGFHMWPKGVPDPTLNRLEAEADEPMEARVPAGSVR